MFSLSPALMNTFGRRAAFTVLAAAIACIAPASAAVVSADASLDAANVITGESFRLRVRVVTDRKESLPWPTVEGLGAFSVSKSTATSTSSQTTVINGAVSRSESFVTDFVFTLATDEDGTFTVGPIRFAHGGFDKELGQAVVTVTRAEPGISTRTSLGKSRVYTGEQVLYTLRIIPRDGVQSINLPEDLQKLIGEKFYYQRLDREITRSVARVDGRDVSVFDIRIALFPLLAGPASLEGIPVEYRRLRPGTSQAQSMFDMFFGGGGSLITQTEVAAPLRLTAVRLPPGAPDGFTGSVGRYSLTASLSAPVVAAGEPVTLTVTVRGNGLPKSVTRPVLPELPGFEVYDPEESVDTETRGDELWTARTFKYVLIPSREGDFALGTVSFPYFDPRRDAYARAESAPLELRVTPGRPGTSAPPLAARGGPDELGDDIRYIKTGDFRLREAAPLPVERPGFYVLALLPPLAFALALRLRRRRDRLRSDAAFSRRTRADAALRRRLKAARDLLGKRSSGTTGREFHRALSDALIAYPSDKLNREFLGLTLPEAAAALVARGASPETAAAYDALRQRCDFVLFAGMNPLPEEMRRDLAEAEALLARLDKELT